MARAGVAVVPEDRHDSGIVLNMSVAEIFSSAIPKSCKARHHQQHPDDGTQTSSSNSSRSSAVGLMPLYGPFREETNSGSSLREKCGGIQRCSSLRSRRGDLMSERSST